MTTPKPLISEFNSREEWEAALDKWLEERIREDEPEEEDVEERYDRFGNISENGIYDAGGHLVDNWYDYIDEDMGKER
jgi:hypothetical protein